MHSGFVCSLPQPTRRGNKVEVCSFTKDDNTAYGAVGVMTDELFDAHTRECTDLLVIMFSVPYDKNIYENWQAVGLFEKTRACDKELFDHMYKDEDEQHFKRAKGDGNGLMHKDKGISVRSCMSSEGRAIIKLELYDNWHSL